MIGEWRVCGPNSEKVKESSLTVLELFGEEVVAEELSEEGWERRCLYVREWEIGRSDTC